jgi:hypothetical protein
MIGTLVGIVFLLLGLSLVMRIWKTQRRLLGRVPSAPDRSVFSAMDLAPTASHRFQARSSKPADTFGSFEENFEPQKRTPVSAPTGINATNDYEALRSGLVAEYDLPAALPRLPLGAEDPDDPKQESLGF